LVNLFQAASGLEKFGKDEQGCYPITLGGPGDLQRPAERISVSKYLEGGTEHIILTQ